MPMSRKVRGQPIKVDVKSFDFKIAHHVSYSFFGQALPLLRFDLKNGLDAFPANDVQQCKR